MSDYVSKYTGDQIDAILDKANSPDTTPVIGSSRLVTSGGVKAALTDFITRSVNDLVYYYTKNETYTKAEVVALIGAIQQFHYEIYASTSAVTNPQSNVLYLIGPTGTGSDKYEEYVYSNGWVKIGDTTIDMSGYPTTEQMNAAINNALKDYATKEEVSQLGQKVQQLPTRQVGYWSNSQNQYISTGGYTLFIPIVGYSSIKVKGRSSVTGEVAFVTAFTATSVSFVSGVSGTTTIAANAEQTFTVPSDAKYLLVFDTSEQNQDRKPSSIIADGYRDLYKGQFADLWDETNNNKEVCGSLVKDVEFVVQNPITQDGFWSNSQNKYVTDSGKSLFVPCSMYETIKLVGQTSSSGYSGEFAFVKGFTNNSVIFVDGVTGTTTLNIGATVERTVPSDAEYLMLFAKDGSNNDRLPSSVIGDGQRNLYKNFIEDMVPTRVIPTVVAASNVRYTDGQISWDSIVILLPGGIQATISVGTYAVTGLLLIYRPLTNEVLTLSSINHIMVGDIVLLYNRNGVLVGGELLPYIDENRPVVIAATGLSFVGQTVSWTSLSLTTRDGRIDDIGEQSYTLQSSPILVYNTKSKTVTQLGGFVNMSGNDILLIYYRDRKPVMGELLGYYLSTRTQTFPVVVAATGILYENGVLSWSSLGIKLAEGDSINIDSGSYELINNAPLLVYRPSSNSVITVSTFSSLNRGDVLLAYYRDGYGIAGGELLPYIESVSFSNERYYDDITYNVYRRGEQLRRVKWTPLAEVKAGEGTHSAGVEVTGIPYSSVKECLKFVGIDVSLHTFMTTIHDSHSLMYTEGPSGTDSRSAYGIVYHGVNCLCYFGNVCSAFVTTALGKLVQDNSWEFKTFFERYEVLKSQEPENFIVGDIISQNGHCAVISNIKRNADGTLNTIYVSEQAALHLNNVITTSGYTVKTLKDRLFVQNAKVCRYKGLREHSDYMPSTFVLLDEEKLYRVGDFVFIDGTSSRTYYKCKTANKDSVFTASKWDEIGTFEADKQYNIGDYASFGDNLYRAPSSINSPTFNPASWVRIPGVFEWASYPYVYNEDIITFAGDRAAFRTNDLIYINYNKGEYTHLQIYKNGELIETISLPEGYQVNVSSYCASAGMYKARLTDGSNYSRYTYFEVIDTTFSVTYQDGVADIRFSSSNGSPLEFQFTEESGYPIAHDAFTDKELASGRVIVNPVALLYVLRHVFWGRYGVDSPEMFVRVVVAGEYGNVPSTMINLGYFDAIEGELIFPDKPNDLGTISGSKNIILAGRTADKSYSFSFVAGASASVSIIPAIGNVVWTESLPTYTQGKAYLFQVINGIGKYTEI